MVAGAWSQGKARTGCPFQGFPLLFVGPLRCLMFSCFFPAFLESGRSCQTHSFDWRFAYFLHGRFFQEEPGASRRSQEALGGASKSQEGPGETWGAKENQAWDVPFKVYPCCLSVHYAALCSPAFSLPSLSQVEAARLIHSTGDLRISCKAGSSRRNQDRRSQ